MIYRHVGVNSLCKISRVFLCNGPYGYCDECQYTMIGARGLSQKELAKRMGRSLNAINEIINGKKAITAETALQL